MNKQPISQLQYGQQRYLVVPVEDSLTFKYSQNTDRQINWGTYVGTNGTQGTPIGVPALNSVDIDGQPLMMSSGPWWIDGNHAIDGDKYLSLAFYVFARPVAGSEFFFNMDFNYMLVDDLHVKGTLQTHNLDLKGAKLGFWVQCQCNKTGKHGNYFFKQDLSHAFNESKTPFELKMSLKDIDNWEVLGTCSEKSDVYSEIAIESLLDDHNVISMGFIIYPYQVKHLFESERNSRVTANILHNFERGHSPDAWPIDTSTLPSGTIVLRDLEINYKKSHILKPV